MARAGLMLYQNQKIINSFQIKLAKLLDNAKENWYKGLKAKLQLLWAINNIESTILVLAFGMALLLHAWCKNTMGIGHLVSLFYGDKPEPPNNQSLNQQYSENNINTPDPPKLICLIRSMVFDALTSLDEMLHIAKKDELAHLHKNSNTVVAVQALALIEQLYTVMQQLYPSWNIRIDDIYA
ncbi:hypothetical protein BCV70DRAFT_209062 [Testicularia cyperi]|uniref:Uncharacterized protein n=1 Tax=Testicularia cyperi TaxID=1882483 RepID=A0A317XED5_9BASI|nr:hypothetical protein BCV70DRAFT_209062 [Testicularia cyperi]